MVVECQGWVWEYWFYNRAWNTTVWKRTRIVDSVGRYYDLGMNYSSCFSFYLIYIVFPFTILNARLGGTFPKI